MNTRMFAASILLALCLHPFAVAQTPDWISLNGPGVCATTGVTQTSRGTFLALTANGMFRADGDLRWQRCSGPAPNTGFVRVAETRNGILIATAGIRGVYQSTDDGVTWSGLELGGYCRPVAVNPLVDEVLVGSTTGVFRSTDGGFSWSSTGLREPTAELAIDSRGVAFAAVISSVRRSDPGLRDEWTTPSAGFTTGSLQALLAASDGSLWVGSSGSEIRKSTDDGITWSRPGNAGLSGSIRLWEIRPGVILASSRGTLIRTTNAGASWSSLVSEPAQCAIWGTHLSTDGRLLAATVRGVMQISDVPGQPLRLVGDGIANATPWSILIGRGDTTLCVASMPAGTSVASLDGSAWSSEFRRFADTSSILNVTRDSRGRFIAAVAPEGLYESYDFRSWTYRAVWSGGALGPFADLAASGATLYVGDEQTVGRRDSNGTWTRVSLPDTAGRIHAVAANGSDVWVATEKGLWCSLDDRFEFTLVWPEKTGSVLPLDSGTVFAGITGGAVLRSTNRGRDWTRSTTGTISTISRLATDSSGTVVAGSLDRVFLSMDNGDTWQERSQGLPSSIMALTIHRGVVYVGQVGYGVYRSAWTPAAAPLDTPPEVLDLR